METLFNRPDKFKSRFRPEDFNHLATWFPGKE